MQYLEVLFLKRKILLILAVLAVALCLSACKENNPENPESPEIIDTLSLAEDAVEKTKSAESFNFKAAIENRRLDDTGTPSDILYVNNHDVNIVGFGKGLSEMKAKGKSFGSADDGVVTEFSVSEGKYFCKYTDKNGEVHSFTRAVTENYDNCEALYYCRLTFDTLESEKCKELLKTLKAENDGEYKTVTLSFSGDDFMDMIDSEQYSEIASVSIKLYIDTNGYLCKAELSGKKEDMAFGYAFDFSGFGADYDTEL